MVAFYGGLLIYLGQQAQTYREEVVQKLENIDASVRRFSEITEPPISSWTNWTAGNEREHNAYMIIEKETWKNSPIEVLDTIATWIITNYTEAVKMDESVRD